MNNHNINDSFFNDIFRPFGVSKSRIMESCVCPLLGSKSVIIIRMYTDKMGCLPFVSIIWFTKYWKSEETSSIGT